MSIMYSLLPFITYWATSLLTTPFSKKSRDDRINNGPTPSYVFYDVLFSTLLSIPFYYTCGVYVFETGDVRWWYLLIGVWLIDTVEYIWHYTLHYFPVLYHSIHSTHHQIRNSYHYAALYQSALDGIVETILLTTSFWLFCFRYEEFIIAMTLGAAASVFDHTGVNTFHSIHHSSHPNCNFQLPFFTYYDHLFGTYYGLN